MEEKPVEDGVDEDLNVPVDWDAEESLSEDSTPEELKGQGLSQGTVSSAPEVTGFGA